MSGVPVPPIASTQGGLHLRRCVRHVTREAAARCPGCGEFFCRECVVEHEGRLLCATCLTRLTGQCERRRHRWLMARRWAAGSAAFLALWIAWYVLGALLLKLPPGFHDGTVWRRIVEREGT